MHGLVVAALLAALGLSTAAYADPPEGCKFVAIDASAVPGINAKPDIPLTLRGYGSDVQAIQACNPEMAVRAGQSNVIGVAVSPTAGARIVLRTKGGIGVVGLPTTYAAGDVHHVICVPPQGENSPAFVIVRIEWSGGLPGELKLVDTTAKETDDAAVNQRGCLAALPPQFRKPAAPSSPLPKPGGDSKFTPGEKTV